MLFFMAPSEEPFAGCLAQDGARLLASCGNIPYESCPTSACHCRCKCTVKFPRCCADLMVYGARRYAAMCQPWREFRGVVRAQHAVAGVEVVRDAAGVPEVVLEPLQRCCLPALEGYGSLQAPVSIGHTYADVMGYKIYS